LNFIGLLRFFGRCDGFGYFGVCLLIKHVHQGDSRRRDVRLGRLNVDRLAGFGVGHSLRTTDLR
jgi:hypothetical protein